MTATLQPPPKKNAPDRMPISDRTTALSRVPSPRRAPHILSRPEHHAPPGSRSPAGPVTTIFPAAFPDTKKFSLLPERKGNIPEKEAVRRRITEHGNKKYFYQEVISTFLFIGTPWDTACLSSWAAQADMVSSLHAETPPDPASGAFTAPRIFPRARKRETV